MKLYDEIRLAVREGKKCLPYLIITALMFAIVSAVASCLFLTAVNLRRDYQRTVELAAERLRRKSVCGISRSLSGSVASSRSGFSVLQSL